MAVSGRRFLQLCAPQRLEISGHALRRLHQATGRYADTEDALALFQCSHQVTIRQILLLGYRPRYGSRREDGHPTWYFRIEVCGREAIAVVTDARKAETMCWITTYGRDRQSDQLRIADWPVVAACT